METELTYVAFAGARRVAGGSLADVLPILKQRFDADRGETVLVFELETGRQVDFDLRGSLDDVLARALPARGPGRPKLGVTSREISLLPRHWRWLEQQPSGASAVIRRLIDRAIAEEPDGAGVRAALGRILTALAGDRPNYEEVTRALWAGDTKRLEALVERWPKDLRELVVERARAASRTPAEIVRALHESAGREPIEELVAAGDRVAVRWKSGQAIYQVRDGRIVDSWTCQSE